MPKSAPQQKPRKTLRQVLRDLVRRHVSISQPTQHTVGSGILRKASTPVPQLPNFSTVSSFPDFSIANYSNHSLLSRASTPTGPPMRPLTPRVTQQHRRLLPSTSLVDLSSTYFERPGPQQASMHAVPEVFEPGISRQASLVSAVSRSPSVSSLRILSSTRLNPSSDQRLSSRADHYRSQSSVSRTHSSRSSLKRSSARQSINTHPAPPPAVSTHPASLDSEHTSSWAIKRTKALAASRAPNAAYDPMMLMEHFKCFVVLDTALPGMPITGTSGDLRSCFEVGEEFVLNNHELEGSSIEITSGLDADGNPVVHLLLFTPLVNIVSGRSRFMLVALVDVTDFINESANQVPELDTISEESSIAEEAVTPTARHSSRWSSPRYKLSADDLLSGCSIPGDEDDFPLGSKEADEDIWLALAATEGRLKHGQPKGYQSIQSSQRSSRSSTSTAQSHATSTDDILDDFMGKLQELYSDLFVLGSSPLAEDAYEICNVSPRVYESKEYINGHLSRTSVEDIERLSRKLGAMEPFSMKVRWGTSGEEKRLYCSPLFGGPSITWICYLVDSRQPKYW